MNNLIYNIKRSIIIYLVRSLLLFSLFNITYILIKLRGVIIMKKTNGLDKKKILLILSSIFFIGIIMYFSIPSIMLKIGNNFNSEGELLKAKGYYDNINKHFPTSAAAETALERSGSIAAITDKILISSSGYGNLQRPIPYLSNETIEYYEEIVTRFPSSPTEKRISYNLLSHNIRKKIEDEHIQEAVNITQDFYIKVNSQKPLYMDATVIKGLIKDLEVNGYYNEAEDLTNFIINYEKDEENIWLKSEFKALLEEINNLKEFGGGKVSGKVTLGDKPFKNLPIFLQIQDLEEENGTIYGYTHDAFWTKTDKDGNFEFENVPEGRYAIGVVADLKNIDDKVIKNSPFEHEGFNVASNEDYTFNIEFVDKINLTYPINGDKIDGETIEFKWEPVEEADYYSLTLGISNNGAVSYRDYGEVYYSPEASISKEDIYYLEGIIGFDSEGPIPGSFLAYLHPEAEIFWGVNAYDEKDRMISSSNGFVKDDSTDLCLEKRELTNGDRRLLDRDYKDAIEIFEANIEKNPEDVHSLLMLARLYGFDNDVPNYPYVDIEKSKLYYERLYEITGNEMFLDKF